LSTAQWLFEVKYDLNLDHYKEAFLSACERGHLEVAQWLLHVNPDIDISTNDDEVFRSVCKGGHLSTAQWFVKIKPNRYFIKVHYLDQKDDYYISYYINKLLPIDHSNIIQIINSNDVFCNDCYCNANLQTSCAHNFCIDCVENFYTTGYTCPYCRSQITSFKKIEIINC
jgi:hypothetical protein